MDEFDELWQDRQEYLGIVERHDPFCTCDDYGEESCPIHSTEDLDLIPVELIECLIVETNGKNSKRKKANNKGKKVIKR